MRIKKILSIAMALTLSFGAVQTIDSAYAKEKDKPADYSGLGIEKFTCVTFDRETGTLTLHGKLVAEELAYFAHSCKVKEIVTEDGTVFPEDCSFLFHDFKDVASIDISGADTSNVTDMYDMFCGCESTETIDLGEFDTSKVTRMDLMFNNCYKLKNITGLDKFDTSNVYTLAGMFKSCHSLTSIDISNFDTSNVTDMAGMFRNCMKLEYVRGLSNFDVSNVKKMSFMFEDCQKIESLQLQYWDTSKVTTMESMFANCTSLKEASFDGNAIDAKFQTYNVSTFENMFLNCKSLQTLKLDHFSASSATNTSGMFMNCEGLECISVTNFAASHHLYSTSNMFSGCSNLETIYMDENWPDSFKENVHFADNMFFGCTNLKGGNDTKYDSGKVGPQYANNDRAGNPGYFTAKKSYIPSTNTESTSTPPNIITTTVVPSNSATTSTTVTSTNASNTTTSNVQSGGKKTPIIIIPGIMGTELYEGKTRVWLPNIYPDFVDFSESIKNDNILNYPNRYSIQNNLDKREYGVVNHMKKMVDTLCDKFPDRDVYVFSYDWRKSNIQTAGELRNFINSLEVDKVDIVAHSMGGLVASEYFSNATKKGDNKADKIITLGTPYEGSPHVFEALEQNKATNIVISDVMLYFSGLSRKVKFEFAGVKELIPTQNYNNMIPIMKKEPVEGNLVKYTDHKMNNDDYIDMLNTEFGSESVSQILNFHNSIRDESNYNVLSNYDNAYFILGQNQKTVKTVYMNYDEIRDGDMTNGYIPGYYIDDVKYTKSGDGTVPYASASMCGKTLSLNNDHQFTIDSKHMQLMNNKTAIDIVCKILNNEKADPHPYFTPDPYAEYDVECPVDVEIGSGNDRLCSASDSISLESSFGRLDIVGKHNEKKMLCIDEDTNFDIRLTGTDSGTMNFTVRHYSGDDELLDERTFEKVPITDKTIIKTKADNNEITVLNIDIDGDGVVDATWTAKKNETVTAPDDTDDTIVTTTTSISTDNITTTTTTSAQQTENINLGDVNYDGQINAVDASSVLSYYAMISTNKDGGYTEEQKLAADVNHDGSINAVDASNILAYYSYLSTTKVDIISITEFMKK